jgi:hypothetical protein
MNGPMRSEKRIQLLSVWVGGAADYAQQAASFVDNPDVKMKSPKVGSLNVTEFVPFTYSCTTCTSVNVDSLNHCSRLYGHHACVS